MYGFMKEAIDEFRQEDVITIPGLYSSCKMFYYLLPEYRCSFSYIFVVFWEEQKVYKQHLIHWSENAREKLCSDL